MALVLTSPPTQGREVREAQRLLKDNVFETNYLDDEVDGVYNLATARSSKRAKRYGAGYELEDIDPGFGETIAGILAGDIKLTDAQKRRKADRAEDQVDRVRAQALKIAKSHLGKEEHPAGSNDVPFTRWYMDTDGDPGWTADRPGPAWCLIFGSKCYVDAIAQLGFDAAGVEEIFRQGVRYAFCPTVVTLAAHGNGGFDQTSKPRPGDFVFYQFDDDSNADHIGIFEEWVQRGSTFHAIEGNTSSSSDANGGRVERRLRSVSSVYRPSTGGRAYVRVG